MNKLATTAVVLAAAAAVAGGVVTTSASADSAVNRNLAATAGSAAVPATTTATPPRVFAVVNADGSFLRGKGVASVTRLSTGTYDVEFTRTIGTCSWVGTVGNGTFVGSTGPAMVTITGRFGTTTGLFVTTFNAAGTSTDLPFSADVICG